MNYIVDNNKIIILTKYFNPKNIFECGQVFSFEKIDDIYFAYPEDKLAAIYFNGEKFVIECLAGDVEFFISYFDLRTNYDQIISQINKINSLQTDYNKKLIKKSIEYGKGIRILRQNILETIISFIFSANNNIKRFKKSLDNLRKDFGHEIILQYEPSLKVKIVLENIKFYSFPNLNVLLTLDKNYFTKIGAGYRASYLVDTIKIIPNFFNQNLNNLSTNELINEILKLKGVGKKVAQCIALFGFRRTDCFPVDTWIKQAYLDINFTSNVKSNEQISKQLTYVFKNYSGFVQQYLFYYKRELKDKV